MPRADDAAPVLPGGFAAHLEAWCAAHGVDLCVVFGSRARGEAREESDVDLAVWRRPLPEPAERLAWYGELAVVAPEVVLRKLAVLRAAIAPARRDFAELVAALAPLAEP